MISSFILPLMFFSLVMGALWWFARGQRPKPVQAPARAPTADPATRRAG